MATPGEDGLVRECCCLSQANSSHTGWGFCWGHLLSGGGDGWEELTEEGKGKTGLDTGLPPVRGLGAPGEPGH